MIDRRDSEETCEGREPRAVDARVRCFVALTFGAEIRGALEHVMAGTRARFEGVKLRWVPPGNLHLTLRFLGDVEVDRLPNLGRSLAEQLRSIPPFHFELGDLMLFPSIRRPRVLAVGLEPGEEISGLAHAVEQGVRAAGLPAEERVFRPHVTLARFSRPARRREARFSSDLLLGIEVPRIGERANRVELVRSMLLPTGAEYSVLESCSLGAGPAAPAMSATEGMNR